MDYTLTTPCDECPFLAKHGKGRKAGYSIERLEEMASNELPCHKTAELVEDDERGSEYVEKKGSLHCAGALIFQELYGTPHQMARICERIRLYDPSKLNFEADIRNPNDE